MPRRALLILAFTALLVCASGARGASLTLKPVTSTPTQLRFVAAGVPLDAVQGATLRLDRRRITVTGARVRAGARAGGRIVLRVRATRNERRRARLVLRVRQPRPVTTTGAQAVPSTSVASAPEVTPTPGARTPVPVTPTAVAPAAPQQPAVTAPPEAGPGAPAAPPGIPVGMHGVLRWRSGEDLKRTVDLMADAGITVDREDIGWYRVQPTAGAPYDWTFADRMVGAAARRGIRILAVLDDAPDWATGARNAPPLADGALTAFSAFAHAAVARYGSAGSYWSAHPEVPKLPILQWEIWNEPYYTFSWATGALPDPLAYGRMFKAVATAAEPADPQAQFLLAANTGVGQAPYPYPPYLAAMLDGVPGLAGHVDAVAIHPYAVDPSTCSFGANWITTIFQFCKVRDVRRILDDHGLQRAGLWITETGWSTAPAADATVTEAQQAANVHTAFASLRQWHDVDGLILYTLHDAAGATDDDREGHFGFLRADGSPKPAWAALRSELTTGVRSP